MKFHTLVLSRFHRLFFMFNGAMIMVDCCFTVVPSLYLLFFSRVYPKALTEVSATGLQYTVVGKRYDRRR